MNIGVAGLGFMGQTHLGIYSKLPGVNVVAAYTRTPGDRKASSTGNLGRPQPAYDLSRVRKYYRWQELIDDSTIDAVDICLPTDQHAPVVMAALAAGKHVFCEKPMALNENECDRMIAARNDSGRTLMVGHVLRFFSEYEYLKEAARSNEHREILSATFIRSCGVPDWSDWLIDENRSGGAILDLLIHDVDQILELFGMPERVTAKRLSGPDTVSASFLYPRPVEVRLQGGWFDAGVPFSMSFQVRTRRALLDFHSGSLYVSDDQGQRRRIAFADSDPFQNELEYFVDCCHNRAAPVRCPPEKSAEAVKLALMLKRSRDLGGEQLKC